MGLSQHLQDVWANAPSTEVSYPCSCICLQKRLPFCTLQGAESHQPYSMIHHLIHSPQVPHTHVPEAQWLSPAPLVRWRLGHN